MLLQRCLRRTPVLRRQIPVKTPALSASQSVRHYYPETPLRPWSVNSLNDFTHCIIGGGVVGICIAARLAQIPGTRTILLERHGACGTETSSRNSEVIHAGLYYPKDSLKTKLCIEGARLLYELCPEAKIPHKRIGKWLLAQTPSQLADLESIHAHATSLGVPTRFIPPAEASTLEPNIYARCGILESPNTGIIDSHAFMNFMQSVLQEWDVDVVVGTLVTYIHKHPTDHYGGYKVVVGDRPLHDGSFITTDTLINAAGLGAVAVQNMLLPKERWRKAYFAKGTYFAYEGGQGKAGRLIYPAPEKGLGGLGTHLTIDMGGRVKFGPDVEWVDNPDDLTPSLERLDAAVDAVRQYMPGIDKAKLTPDYCGIRPKLGPKGSPFQDFYIKEEEGFPGFVNLLGIESPGLTSSLAIAEYVEELLYAPYRAGSGVEKKELTPEEEKEKEEEEKEGELLRAMLSYDGAMVQLNELKRLGKEVERLNREAGVEGVEVMVEEDEEEEEEDEEEEDHEWEERKGKQESTEDKKAESKKEKSKAGTHREQKSQNVRQGKKRDSKHKTGKK
ncbi:FAD dependent oxidoreductase-domain-containing protein [Kalaharituber pfeilii]|nr:FAD dependent oxidoreductase-domain-containing protein [Kalaharituber pfeilii]